MAEFETLVNAKVKNEEITLIWDGIGGILSRRLLPSSQKNSKNENAGHKQRHDLNEA